MRQPPQYLPSGYATALLCVMAFLPQPVAGSPEEASEHLESYAQVAGVLQGFSPRGEIWRGLLKPGESTLIPEQLMQGNDYLVIATGDATATDINLELLDDSLIPVGLDREADNTPLVSVTPAISGKYFIRVTLVSSTGPSAWYAVQVMYR